MKILRLIYVFFALLTLQEITAQTPSWTINPANYQYTMSVIGVGLFDCEQTGDSNDMVAAFINDSLAGFAKFNTIIGSNAYAFLTVYSNVPAGEIIEYKLFDSSSSQIEDAILGDVFQQNASIGTAITPFEFKTDFVLSSLSLLNDTIYDYSSAGDTVSSLLLLNELMAQEQASYTFVNDSSGIDNLKFSLIGDYLILEETVDILVQESYQIHIRATSLTGCVLDEIFTISVFNTNVPPTDIIQNPAYVDENNSIGAFIALLQAVDATPIDYHNFELVGAADIWPDNEAFIINYDELLANKVFDYEEQNEFRIQIEVKDATGNSYLDTFTVIVVDEIESNEGLKAPNYISPNGDGVNDFFIIENVELYFDYSLYFYNDNGNLVYSNEGAYDNSWNGISNKGQELPSATYFFYFVNRINEAENFKGKVMIERPTKY